MRAFKKSTIKKKWNKQTNFPHTLTCNHVAWVKVSIAIWKGWDVFKLFLVHPSDLLLIASLLFSGNITISYGDYLDRRHVNQVYQRFIFLKAILLFDKNFLFNILPTRSFNKIEGQGLHYFSITNKPELRCCR